MFLRFCLSTDYTGSTRILLIGSPAVNLSEECLMPSQKLSLGLQALNDQRLRSLYLPESEDLSAICGSPSGSQLTVLSSEEISNENL